MIIIDLYCCKYYLKNKKHQITQRFEHQSFPIEGQHLDHITLQLHTLELLLRFFNNMRI